MRASLSTPFRSSSSCSSCRPEETSSPSKIQGRKEDCRQERQPERSRKRSRRSRRRREAHPSPKRPPSLLRDERNPRKYYFGQNHFAKCNPIPFIPMIKTLSCSYLFQRCDRSVSDDKNVGIGLKCRSLTKDPKYKGLSKAEDYISWKANENKDSNKKSFFEVSLVHVMKNNIILGAIVIAMQLILSIIFW